MFVVYITAQNSICDISRILSKGVGINWYSQTRSWLIRCHHSWASYKIRKIAGCACASNAGNVFPRHRFKRKPLVSDPGMHHGTCVTHVPWYMSGSLTCGDGENVPGIPGACAPANLRIWQEAHCGYIKTVGYRSWVSGYELLSDVFDISSSRWWQTLSCIKHINGEMWCWKKKLRMM